APADPLGVVRTGRIDDARLKALFVHARAFVFPSLYEGFGIPPLEAMACGCAVIASDAASIPEICGDAAGYFDPTSIASIRDALLRILRDDAWHAALREAGRARAEIFTWDASAAQLLEHLHRFGVVTAPSR
ncbi:MAG: glycosyltransferase, partial [Pseudomonadota bacterium]|nr:glycosyltransferase [Pseudomonadota bacterium]